MGGSDFITALGLARNGWVYAAGGGGANDDFTLVQYRPDGTLPPCREGCFNTWPSGKAYADCGGFETAWAIDVRADNRVVAAGCVDGQLGWAQVTTTSAANALKVTADFVGAGECAFGVQYTGTNKLVAAATQTFNGDANLAVARFETTVDPTVDVPAPDRGPVVAPAFTRFSPNPTRGAVEMEFELPHAGHVTVAVYDLQGRLVARAAEGDYAEGRHAIRWDAGETRRDLASGIYFVRIETPGWAAARRVVVMPRGR